MGVHRDFWKRRKAQLVDELCSAEKRGDTEAVFVALRAVQSIERARLERIREEHAPAERKVAP